MKNLTITLDDNAYQRARVYAAQKGKSLSALVREILERTQNLEEDTHHQAPSLFSVMDSIPTSYSAAKRLERSKVHER